MTTIAWTDDIARNSQRDSLIGRADELALIDRFLDQAAHEGGALLLSGELGVGKTALLDAAAESALASGRQVLRAAGVEFEAELPFSALNQLLLSLAPERAVLPESQRAALEAALGAGEAPPHARLFLCNAVLTLLQAIADRRPLVVIVDDVHWLDRSSSQVVAFLARRLAATRMAFLAALRTGEDGMFESVGLDKLEVRPLAAADAELLLNMRYPQLTGRVRRGVLAAAEGNPLAVLELPQARVGGAISVRGAQPHSCRLQTLS